jgi:type I restriction enzyme S subunit
MSAPPLSAIGEQVDPVSSWTPERDDPDGVFTYIDLSAVDHDAKVVSGARELACAEAPSRARQLIRAGDVLVSTVRPNLNGVALVPPELDGATASTGFCVLRPRAGQLDARYLYQWVKSPFFVSDMVRKATGASYPAVSDRIVCESKLPLPPLPEQRRIAEILDKADALRAKRRAALAQLDTLSQSIFLDMFGDPATNPKGWPTRKVEDVAQIVSGATPRTDNESYWDGDVNWVTPKELSGLESIYIGETERRITRQGLESCAASILPPGSVLFSSRAPIGHTAICTAPMASNQGFKSFVPRRGALEPHFLLFWLRLRRSFLEGLGMGATFKEVSKAVVARVELCVPPFDLQSQFARRVVALERIRSVQREGRGQLDGFFASLQHRAFRGEL